jgi:hypothetical protein
MKHITSLSIALVAFWTLPGAQAISPPADPPAKPAAASTSAGTAKQKEDSVRELDWEELLPKTQGGNFTLDAPPQPPPNHYLDESGPGATQYGSAEVNKDLNGVRVKIPGYIVPLQITGTGRVPPPNQIVYVRMKQGIDLNSVYDAHWITGRLKTAVFESKMASAAYSLEGEKDELYKY